MIHEVVRRVTMPWSDPRGAQDQERVSEAEFSTLAILILAISAAYSISDPWEMLEQVDDTFCRSMSCMRRLQRS